MAARAGAGITYRRGVGPLVEMKARVSPEVRDRARLAAEACGISMAELVEWAVLRAELDEEGVPRGWERPVPADQEELPLKSA